MNLFHKILILLFGVAISVHAVPPVLNFAGQVAVNGEAFDGNGLFKFALVNADGTTTYWSNDGTSVDGSQPQASVAVSVNGGLYSILLGNTALPGMGAIQPAVFAQHTDAKLRVWFSDGVNGFQQLSPDRPFASVPYAFSSESAKSAETAKTAEAANVAMAVQAGAITKQMLGNDVLTDINATIGMNRLSSEVTEKLNQEKTTNNYNAPSVGSLLAVPYGSDAPAGYSLYQQGEPKALVWEEKAPVSFGRWSTDGVEVFNGEIYFLGGKNTSVQKIVERYKPESDSWETLNPMSIAREGSSCAVLAGKIYAIGGMGLTSVEIYDPATDTWSNGTALPSVTERAYAIVVNGLIYLVGGRNDSGHSINQVLCFNPSANQWTPKANMPTSRHGAQLVWFENRIWAIGGNIGGSDSNKVESYDPATDTWLTESPLITARNWAVAWVANARIYVGGGRYNSNNLSSIESYNPITKKWSSAENFPEIKYVAGMVVLNEKAYVIAGITASNVYSNKVYAADLNASMEGVYDLYRKDGDAPVGTPVVQSEYADGSVTASKMAEGAVSKSALDATILKYLKPEITTQPQAQTVYAHTNATFSVTAEGKYLSYQWKKDGVDLVGETNATLNITDANATLHDGNYSVAVSNDFGSIVSNLVNLSVVVFDPSHIGNLIGWFDANDSSTVLLEDNTVKEWLDKSDLKNNFSQILPESMPEYSNNSIVFDGLNDSLSWGNPQTRNTFNIFFVKKSSDTQSLDFWGQTGSYYIFVQQQNSSADAWHTFGLPKTFINGLPYNFTNRGYAYTVVHDGQLKLISILDGDTSGWTDFRIGNYPSYEFAGAFHEIIFLEGEIDYITRNRIEGYLAHKWGLTADLPLDHPYKNNHP